ncbi:MAG: hypothetical protein KF774_04310 [Planctomyces sp.]|nr:hypothetical protein [Planctomyces sp.]
MSLFDTAMIVQGFPVGEARTRMQALTRLSADDLQAHNESQRWAIARHHYDHNPFYRSLVGGAFPSAWTDLPCVTKYDLQRPLSELIARGVPQNRLYVSSTSGSTGHPFFFAKDKLSHALSWELVRQRYALHGVRMNGLQARVYGIPLNASGYWKERLKDWIANRVRLPVFDLSEEALARFLAEFARRRFEYVYGYTSAVARLCEFVLTRNTTLKDLCPTLKAGIVTSEVCTPEDRATIARALGGPPVVNEYGASELGVLGFEWPDGVMRGSDELVHLETAPDEHGIPRLLCTSLTNTAFPMIRYAIGDAVELDRVEGRTVIRSIEGRVNDFAVLPSGKVSAGLTFYYIARRALETSDRIREFVVRQVGPGAFVFDVVARQPLTTDDLAQMQDNMDRYLEPGLTFEINYVDAIQRGRNGKLRHFTNTMPAAPAGSETAAAR